MKTQIINVECIDKLPKNTTLCLGYFDGVHRGHQLLIEKARKHHHKVAILTFDISPFQFFSKTKDKSQITPLLYKKELFKLYGVDYFLILKFNIALANMSYLDFVNKILLKLNPDKIVVGQDYSFGKNKIGNPTILKTYFDVEVVPLLTLYKNKIASSNIAKFLLNGKVNLANKMLGRKYTLYGTVIKGYQNGRKIGFPTANLKLNLPFIIPKNGVYAGECFVSKNKLYKCLISVGNHPTINKLNKPIIEVHIIDFCADIYDKKLKISFIRKIRSIKKFKNLDELKSQLEVDKQSIFCNLKS